MKIVDATDWLDNSGDLPVTAPPDVYRDALRVAQCIEYGGPLPPSHLVLTLIPCRRRPDGVACRGTLLVSKTQAGAIHALCQACHSEEFLITNWEDTLFADGPPEPIPLAAPEPTRSSPPAGLTDALARALARVDCTLSVEAIVDRIATADRPTAVIEYVLAHSRPAGMPQVQALAGALMALWNETPRPDLGNRTPSSVFAGREGAANQPVRSSKVGRNQPCPCKSGKKYKKCCGAVH